MTVRAGGVAAALNGRPALLRDTCDRALASLDGLAGRPVAPAAADVAGLEALDFALPGPGLRAAAVLRMLDKFGSPATLASGGPRNFRLVPRGGGAHPPGPPPAPPPPGPKPPAAGGVPPPAGTGGGGGGGCPGGRRCSAAGRWGG